MKTLKVLIMTATALICSGFHDKGTWIIDGESQLTIQGSTNVNNFICRVEYYTGTDTLLAVENSNRRELQFTRSKITVPIRSFDCGAKPISRDFWKTLKSETHPTLKINFVSLETPSFEDSKNVKGDVRITLAGVTATYTICYQVKVHNDGTILLKGNHAVQFSDFGLEAPQKLKGLIKVKEGLHVEFNLLLRKV